MRGEGERGTYSLVVEVGTSERTAVGSLGALEFPPGWYAYAGSAQGPGGFGRIDRHRAVAQGERETRHWHVDHLLGLDGASVDTSIRTPGADGECAVAGATAAEPIEGFGATDCDCPTHLHYAPQRDALVGAVHRAHAGLRDCARTR